MCVNRKNDKSLKHRQNALHQALLRQSGKAGISKFFTSLSPYCRTQPSILRWAIPLKYCIMHCWMRGSVDSSKFKIVLTLDSHGSSKKFSTVALEKSGCAQLYLKRSNL
uniref:Uncharacterized protein n=1 Tax=Romanomermis culicivorax TaxID=13658 RepID=A0A915KSM4_ROMCU